MLGVDWLVGVVWLLGVVWLVFVRWTGMKQVARWLGVRAGYTDPHVAPGAQQWGLMLGYISLPQS